MCLGAYRKDYKNYGIEVKRGREPARTGNLLLEKGKLDHLYTLKDTYGGIAGNKYTVPLYHIVIIMNMCDHIINT